MGHELAVDKEIYAKYPHKKDKVLKAKVSPSSL